MARFIDALRRARLEKPIEFVTMIVTVPGLVIGLVGAAFVYFQFLDLRKNLDSQAYGIISQELGELNRLFVEHPEMRPYFYAREPLPDDELKRNRILAVADVYLDFIDNYYSQASHLDWSHYNRGGWDAFIRGSFERSWVLCYALCKDQDEFGDAIRDVASGICKGVTRSPAGGTGKPTKQMTDRSEARCRQP
ncbi:MAG: hypothetical protein AB7F22_16900 [Reyranella sp.]|uniref:hypothetical protein n=1 Tax=Reyranella sp. TaxID=1929291 RepID=UPI003D09EB68